MNRSTQDIRREAEQLLKAAGVTGAPVVLRDVVSYLNLSLVERAREPFSSEAALVPLGEGHAIELRGTSNARCRRSPAGRPLRRQHPGDAPAPAPARTRRAPKRSAAALSRHRLGASARAQ